MDISSTSRYKAPDTDPQQGSTPAPSGPKSILDLSLETVALVGEWLSPSDFVSMVSSCRQWRSLKDVPFVTRRVAESGRLCPPPLCDFSGPTMLPPEDPWADILFEARLLGRLQRGPLEVEPMDPCCSYSLALNGQHLLLHHSGGQSEVRHLDGYGRTQRVFPAHQLNHFLEFAADGNALVGSEFPYGPVQLFDLTPHARPPRTIAPQVDYCYQSVAVASDGNSYSFACSDGHLRTYAADPDGHFRLSCDSQLDPTVSLSAVSDNGKVLIALDQDADHAFYQVYCRRLDSSWKKACKIKMPECCPRLTLSPLGRFVLTDSCSGGGLYAVDPNASAPHEAKWHTEGILSPDETKMAVETEQGFVTYRWPDLKRIGHYKSGWHEDLIWLWPYLKWQSQSLKLAVESDDDGDRRIRIQSPPPG